MELDELKNLWQKQGAAFRPRNEAEIAAMLKGTSKSIVTRLVRTVWFELILTIIAGTALLLYALTLESSPMKTISICVLVAFVLYSIYYVKKIILLNKFDSSGDNIRINLEKLITSLSSYLKYYRLSYTILYPVYFGLGVFIGGLKHGSDHFFEIIGETKTILVLLAFAVVFYFTSTWFIRWYLQKLYGNHLNKLRLLLHDLQNETTA